jgi:hypothetical protein
LESRIGDSQVDPYDERSFGAVVGGLLSLLGTFLLQAALVKAVQDARDGRGELDLPASIVPGLILLTLPSAARNSISDFVVGTLFAPFLAAVVTLVYDRLTVAHGQQPDAGMAPGAPPAGGYGQYDGA